MKTLSKKIILELDIESGTTPGDYHKVRFYRDGRTECNCIGKGFFKKDCQHIKQAVQILETIKEICEQISIKSISIKI